KPFLRKVVQALARRGYVTTHRGTGGGIALARDPRAITLRAIVEAIDGPIALNRCVARPGDCPLSRRCTVHPVWHRIQRLVLDELERTTIASLRHDRAA
ncbi:MAG: Rrf2 family transcriptional regulator, partial [Armatimonadota bacterium]|nr:Rrf2 family transcriptional regulator [Armatimonadota bacterium]